MQIEMSDGTVEHIPGLFRFPEVRSAELLTKPPPPPNPVVLSASIFSLAQPGNVLTLARLVSCVAIQ